MNNILKKLASKMVLKKKIFLGGDIIALHRYKAIFFPIPKVANTSFKAFCSDLLFDEIGDEFKSLTWKPLPFRTKEGKEHLKNKNILISYEISKSLKHYWKFCFVRNPHDRLVSCYKEKIKEFNYNDKDFYNGVSLSFLRRYKNLFFSGMSFEIFANNICEIPDSDSEKHFRSQHLFITDRESNIIVDYIGRFENLQADFNFIRQKLFFPIDIELPHLLATNKSYYKSYYSNDLFNRVSKRYAKDIDLFDYN